MKVKDQQLMSPKNGNQLDHSNESQRSTAHEPSWLVLYNLYCGDHRRQVRSF